jgi:hypothetical protein
VITLRSARLRDARLVSMISPSSVGLRRAPAAWNPSSTCEYSLWSLSPSPQVVAGQRLEGLEVAERELDVHVQTARAHHRGVLAPAHGEHHDTLLAAARRDAIHEAQHPDHVRHRVSAAALKVLVQVLDEDERARGGVQEQRAGVVAGDVGTRQVDVVDVVAQEPGHGRRERGLACAQRAVEEVAAASDAAEAMVVGAALEEALEVGADAGLEVRVHGHGIQRGRVGEGRRRPARRACGRVHAGVGEEAHLAAALLHLLGHGLHVLPSITELRNDGHVIPSIIELIPFHRRRAGSDFWGGFWNAALRGGRGFLEAWRERRALHGGRGLRHGLRKSERHCAVWRKGIRHGLIHISVLRQRRRGLRARMGGG